jgi:PhnB protein
MTPSSPFDALRDDADTVATPPPDPAFVRGLRRDVEAALAAAHPSEQIPTRDERTPTMTSSSPSSTTTGAAAATNATALVPYLAVRGGTAALDWYRDVFGAVEVMRFTGDDGRVGHAELQVGDVRWYLADEYPDIGVVGPATLGNTSVSLHLSVDDVDALHARAVAAGAEDERSPSDESHGSRQSSFRDPFGHRWMLSTQLREMSIDELDAASDDFTVTEG